MGKEVTKEGEKKRKTAIGAKVQYSFGNATPALAIAQYYPMEWVTLL